MWVNNSGSYPPKIQHGQQHRTCVKHEHVGDMSKSFVSADIFLRGVQHMMTVSVNQGNVEHFLIKFEWLHMSPVIATDVVKHVRRFVILGTFRACFQHVFGHICANNMLCGNKHTWMCFSFVYFVANSLFEKLK